MASTYVFKSEDYYRHFIDSLKSNRRQLKAFITFLGIPDDDKEQYSRLIDNKSVKDIEEDVSRFIRYLVDRHYALASQKSHLNSIIHFYVMNDIILNRKKLSKYLSSDAPSTSKLI